MGAKSALDQVLMSAQIAIHWITEARILENVLAIKDFLMMELRSVCNASINGKVIGFNIKNSYKCENSADYCTDCNTGSTHRILSSNKCYCDIGFYDDGSAAEC